MKLSYNWLKELVPIKLSPEKLAELLTFHVAEIEKVEKMGGDTILHMDVLPNRAHDLNSHMGVAREIAALANIKYQISNIKFGEDKKKKTADVLSVRIEDAQGCPRYIGRYMENVKIGPSPKWLKEQLEALGMRSINNVVDATNYVMLEYGQPLHAFDAEQIANSKKQITKKEIIVRKAKKGEKFTMLDDQEFALDGSELLIADSEKPLALAGIKGGKKAGITSKTKNLILEAANFDSTLIRRTSAKLNLRTDSSKQFQGGLHPALAERAMTRLAALIGELAGGTVFAGAVDIYPKKWQPVRIVFNASNCNTLLGVNLKEVEMKRMLVALGCAVENMKSSSDHSFTPSLRHSATFLATAPAERLDLATPEDLYEEIGRLYGWENIKSAAPHVPVMSAQEEPIYPAAELIRKIVTGMGYSEHVGHTFISKQAGELFKKSGLQILELENPMSEDACYLRPTLMPSLLQAVSLNARRNEAVRMFEIGKTFWRKEGASEEWSLGIALWLKREPKKHEAWYEIKGVLEAFFSSLGLADALCADMPQEKKETLRTLFEPSALGYVLLGNEVLGSIGAVSVRMKDLYAVEGVLMYAQIDVAALLARSPREREFAEIPKFPGVMRDVAVLVQKGTKVETVQDIIEREGGELLFDVDLFDVYEGAASSVASGEGGKGVGDNEESLAFHLVFQSAERTLRDTDIQVLMEKIVQGLKNEGWEIRE